MLCHTTASCNGNASIPGMCSPNIRAARAIIMPRTIHIINMDAAAAAVITHCCCNDDNATAAAEARKLRWSIDWSRLNRKRWARLRERILRVSR